ncbi:CotH kinase family protein [Allorhodopirellula solitaria]|uniref:CotH protein n=1 Tax=Allorhodopirellula solitaria TaxID=2527987 RepID=A0A5C5X833_9BACT|nr:CotH kinase family protein [Allorhodopirellula solitaria]TWT59297.1 CotH protein [Allorhodopirellula solitaria]
MTKKRVGLITLSCLAGVTSIAYVFAQPPGEQEKVLLLEAADTDGNGWLDDQERAIAREEVQSGQGVGFDLRGMARRFGRGGEMPAPEPGKQISKDSVTPQEGDLYDPSVLRTVFIDFASDDWESELEDFHNTDVEVPATLTVDGEEFPNCGIRFRGASSYGHVPSGHKRSLNVSVDMADDEQRVLGYKTLNLLNAHGDDSMLSTVLYSHIARQHIAAPKANFVRVVINGENWGVFTNVEQFNKDFLKANFGSKKGARWKVHGSPRGGGGLDYRGEDLANYEHPYEQKSGGKKSLAKLAELCRVLEQTPTEQLPAALEPICDVDGLLWFLALDNGLINGDGYWVRASDYSIYLDPDDRFHIIPHDMNEAFQPARGGRGGPGGPGGPRGPGGPGGPDAGGGRGGPEGRGFGPGGFGPGGPPPGGEPRQRDARGRGPERGRPEGDRPQRDERGGPGGPGRGGPGRGGPGRGGPGRGGPPAIAGSAVELDPMIGMNDPSKPLRSKVLAVPQYREQYLRNVRQLAEESLDWSQLGRIVDESINLIGEAVREDTKKLSTYEAFVAATHSDDAGPDPANADGGRRAMNIKSFAEARQKYLLEVTTP